jgi:hypothetical protein
MKTRHFNTLLLFSLFGITLWFFGNLYEAVVIVPNMLENSVAKAHAWQAFFTTTNPVFFYVPLAPLATVAAIILYFRVRKASTVLKSQLRIAAICSVLALAIGAYIIIQINLKLFFGDIGKYAGELHGLAVLWNILNGVRVILLAVAVTHLFRAYMWLVRHKEA